MCDMDMGVHVQTYMHIMVIMNIYHEWDKKTEIL